MFNALLFFQKVLGGLGIAGIEERAVAWLTEKGNEYPDIRSRTDALAAWLQTTIAEASPELDPAKMRDTLWGVASDAIHGTAGVDPKAWTGAA